MQFASGALINTAGNSSDAVSGSNGYGNVEFNGLPAASNGYIVDGLETNDPLTNLNIGLSTNLVLGMNSISEVTVNTLSYSVDQGRYGASQVNYVTKSGSNQFHGNAYETWNGAALNAADYFTRIVCPRETCADQCSKAPSEVMTWVSVSSVKSPAVDWPLTVTGIRDHIIIGCWLRS